MHRVNTWSTFYNQVTKFYQTQADDTLLKKAGCFSSRKKSVIEFLI